MTDLETELRQLYPTLFREPVVCGVSHPAGWHPLVKSLSVNLENMTKDWPEEWRPYCTQTKEKFGTLRFYFEPHDERVAEVVAAYENLSGQLCDQCGEPGSLRKLGGWYLTTRCEEHSRDI